MKRMICLMLTLVMLVSLVPMAAVTASAASFKTSEAAITVLKDMVTFKKQCYQVADTQEFRIGYGTVCNKKGHSLTVLGEPTADHQWHTIKESEADRLLREALTEMDKKVNTFATNNKLALKQNQFDALVVFSYLTGTAWMNGNGVVKTAVVNQAGAAELLTAMISLNGNAPRSKIIVNMYKNNVYSNVVPTSFATVTYDANGGSMAQGSPYEAYFDTAAVTSHVPVPKRNGYKFLGWYFTDGSGNLTSRSASLTSACANKTLMAGWQDNSVKPEYGGDALTVNYTISKSKLASPTIFKLPDIKSENKGTVPENMTVTRDYLGSDGSRWGMIGDYQWVLITAGTNGVPSVGGKTVKVTVTNSYVNRREKANIYSAKTGSYNQGDQLYILNTETATGFLWGQVVKGKDDHTPVGWIALMYTNWNTAKDKEEESSNNANTNTSKAIARATITYNGYVNMRASAGTDSKIVGALGLNETVDVFEIKVVNGHQWGRTNGGWFCMTYASVTMLGSNSDVITDETGLTYTYPGVIEGTVVTRTSASASASETATTPKSGAAVTIHNSTAAGGYWVKIGWKEKELDKNGKEVTVTKYGWLQLNGDRLEDSGSDASEGGKLKLTPVKFTVTANEVTIRENPNSGSLSVNKMNKGVEVEIHTICLVGEEIWGYVSNEYVVKPDGTADENGHRGWANLSTKYFKRSDVSAVKPVTPPTSTGLIATVVGTDKVNVRSIADIYGKLLGTLTRGTTASVLEVSDKGWYKLDKTMGNGECGWVYKDYLDVREGTTSGSNANNGGAAPTVSGTGVVANTYAGVNVRTGAGTAYASLGKLLPGTAVEILEVRTVGSAKWGRIDKGWVCMDYITMLTDLKPITPAPENPGVPEGGTSVGSYDEVDRTTTTAVYTGSLKADTPIYASTEHHNESATSFIVRDAYAGEPITVYELIAVTERVHDDSSAGGGHGTDAETTITSYWARVNDGYIFNPQDNIQLNALDEKVHTVTGSDTLNVRMTPSIDGTAIGLLKKGEKVKVTALAIEKDKVWGRIEYTKEDSQEENGWIRLDYTSEGAYYVPEKPTTPTTPEPPKEPELGNTGNTGNGGFVDNKSPYLYTGKVINTDSVNVRSLASTAASKTTTLKRGQSLVIYETTIAENMAWGRCDAGWVYLYYVDLVPTNGALDARVVFNDNTVIFSDSSCSEATGTTYARMSVVYIYEVVGKMARTDLGWVDTDNLLS